MNRYVVPYEYLTSRTVVGERKSMSRALTEQDWIDFRNNCNGRCYIPVYRKRNYYDFEHHPKDYYQVLSDVASNCQVSPNCLDFNEAEYTNYSLIYENEGITNPNPQCSTINSTTFIPPKCPSEEWQFFLRSHGKRWCYRVFASPENTAFSVAEKLCEKEGAWLNGIESKAEYNAFSNYAKKIMADSDISTSCAIGARREPNSTCDQFGDSNDDYKKYSTCLESLPMLWSNKTSRFPNVTYYQTNIKYIDGTGYCMTYAPHFDGYDDVRCGDPVSHYACGRYAT